MIPIGMSISYKVINNNNNINFFESQVGLNDTNACA